MLKPRRRSREGMTLLEVLIAMAVFLLALAGIAQLIDFGSNNAQEAARTTTATRLCQSKMAEVEAGVVNLQGSTNGTFDDEPDWSYTVDVQSPGPVNLYLVTVKVSRDVRGKPFEMTLSQHLMDPTRMGTAAQAEKPTTTTATTTGGTP